MKKMLAAGMMWMGALATAQEKVEPLKVDEKAGTVSFGARAAKQDVYAQLKGAIEYLVVMPGGKEYEGAFIAPIDPLKLNEGLLKIGLKAGQAGSQEEKRAPEGAKLLIWIEWGEGDKKRREPVEKFVSDTLSKKTMESGPWIFTGSREVFDPVTEKNSLGVVSGKNVISLFHNDANVLIQPSAMAKDPHQFKANRELLPKEGTPVRIVIEAAK